MDSVSQWLDMAAHADLSTTLLAAALLGLLSHMPIRSFEFERVLSQFIAACVACFFGISAFYYYYYVSIGQSGGDMLYATFAKSLLVQVAFHSGLLASIAVYRLAFHRCHPFPGPVGAKLSRFYTVYLASRKVQYHKDLLRMHAKYGDFVRTGPREVSVLRKAAVDAIVGPNSKCRKSSWYDQSGYDQTKVSLHMCRDHLMHRRRRRAWDRGLSIKALATYVPRVQATADLLVQRLREQRSTAAAGAGGGTPGVVVDVTEWTMFFAFDLIGDVGYGKSFDQLVTLEEHLAVKPIHEHLVQLGIFANVPWFLNLMSAVPGSSGAFASMWDFCRDQRRSKQKTWSDDKQPSDIVSWLLKAMSENDGTGPPSIEALDGDTRLLLGAGSETSASALSHALFFLARYPEKQQKLRAALFDEAKAVLPIPGAGAGAGAGGADWSYETVLRVRYLDHFINETLRLKPSLFISGRYETPPEGIQIDEVRIPGHVILIAPLALLQRDPRYWQRPDEFLPERWGDDDLGTDSSSPYFPFSLGAYSCPGKNLALMSLRIALSALLRNFEVGFAPGETGVEFDNEAKDTFTVTLPPLKLQFTPLSGAE